jgi:hypothetical protein
MPAAFARFEMTDLPADLAVALRPRVERLGYLGEFFKCAAHQPQALLSFMRFTDDLKDALPSTLTEVVALSVAGTMRNDYERHQHERLCRTLGCDDAWIRSVEALQPDTDDVMADDERRVQRLALAVLANNGHGVQAELAAVIETVGPAQAMAVLMLIGRYATHAFIVNALQLNPPVPSIFEP